METITFRRRFNWTLIFSKFLKAITHNAIPPFQHTLVIFIIKNMIGKLLNALHVEWLFMVSTKIDALS
jgi:hypothetical protein